MKQSDTSDYKTRQSDYYKMFQSLLQNIHLLQNPGSYFKMKHDRSLLLETCYKS